MNIAVYFAWRHPAPTYITCRETDIPVFKALGYVQEADAPMHLAKISRPETDLLDLVDLARQGASFHGNIEPTPKSGPALIAGRPGELVIVPANDAWQPVVAMREDGTMVGVAGALAYCNCLSAVNSTFREDSSHSQHAPRSGPVGRLLQEWDRISRRLRRRR